MIDPKTDPIAAAREALTALDFGGNWNNVDAPALVRNLLALIDGSDVPPTEAETRENPYWFVSVRGEAFAAIFMSDGRVLLDDPQYNWNREEAIERLTPGRWVPLDENNGFRPMPRPVVPR